MIQQEGSPGAAGEAFELGLAKPVVVSSSAIGSCFDRGM